MSEFPPPFPVMPMRAVRAMNHLKQGFPVEPGWDADTLRQVADRLDCEEFLRVMARHGETLACLPEEWDTAGVPADHRVGVAFVLDDDEHAGGADFCREAVRMVRTGAGIKYAVTAAAHALPPAAWARRPLPAWRWPEWLRRWRRFPKRAG